MLDTELRQLPGGPLDTDPIRDAFLDMHGRSLHGFALLLCLGDRRVAAELASDALADATDRLGDLRHPERAAAWLRAHVLRAAPRRLRLTADGEATLAEIGADVGIVRSLAGLGLRERAALIATTIERLDPRDVGIIVDRDGARLDAIVASARRRYLRAYLRVATDVSLDGPIAAQVHETALRAIG